MQANHAVIFSIGALLLLLVIAMVKAGLVVAAQERGSLGYGFWIAILVAVSMGVLSFLRLGST